MDAESSANERIHPCKVLKTQREAVCRLRLIGPVGPTYLWDSCSRTTTTCGNRTPQIKKYVGVWSTTITYLGAAPSFLEDKCVLLASEHL